MDTERPGDAVNSALLVVDASVLLKWYLSDDEPYRKQAFLLFDRFARGEVRIVLPDLALYELGNRFLRMGLLGRRLFDDALTLFTDVSPLSRQELRALFDWVAHEQERSLRRLTIYDGVYIQLARVMKCRLITADAVQARGANAAGVDVLLLKDYS